MCLYILLIFYILILYLYIGDRLISALIHDTPFHISPQLLLDCSKGKWAPAELSGWGRPNMENN